MGRGKCLPTRLSELEMLNLKSKDQFKLKQIVDANRMDWELWIESASSFKSFKEAQKQRGISGLPISDRSEISESIGKVNEHTVKKLPNQKTMMRKGRN